MKTSRKDIKRDKRLTECSNASFLGFSTNRLHYGDYFLTNDGQFAKYHGRVKPDYEHKWYILAQVANPTMQYSMERWIMAEDVIETIPAERCHPEIAEFFIKTEDFFA